MSPCNCADEAAGIEQRRVLGILLAINAAMFVVEFIVGLIGQSTGLIADALDMLADAAVYALALAAVGRAWPAKARAARISGIAQIVLACGVVLDVVRRFIEGSEPVSALMMAMGLAALLANLACLLLLARHRRGEVHMRASWIFSRNDVLANLGVMLAGALVALSGSPLPDLVIGLGIALLVMTGGIGIIRAATAEAEPA
jgi:cation diffusion facilitator family transporter